MLRDRMRAFLSRELTGEAAAFEADREAALETVLEAAAAPYDQAIKELDRLHAEFRERVAARRNAVDRLRSSEGRIAELEGEIRSLPQRLTEAQLADDEGRVKELKTAHGRVRRELSEAEAEREKAASELEGVPSELELAEGVKERTERIAGNYGHVNAAFLYGPVRSMEMEKIHDIQAAARRLAREHTSRGGVPSGLTLTFDRTRRVSPDHADYVEAVDG